MEDDEPTTQAQTLSPAEAEPAVFNLSSGWEWARTLLNYIASLFDDPVALKEEGFITRLARRHLLEWLAPLEVFVRRLLFIEAAALPWSAGLQARVSRSTSKLCAPEGARSGPRRVSFRLLQQKRGKQGVRKFGGSASTNGDEDQIPSEKIAQRFSALVRVINDPKPYARRLAKLLRTQTYENPVEVGAPRFRINPVGAMFDEAYPRACDAARSVRENVSPYTDCFGPPEGQ